LRHARQRIGDAIDDRLSYADMARLVGLSDPTGNGKDTMRKWEDGADLNEARISHRNLEMYNQEVHFSDMARCLT
jgi:hypothetical protein